MGRSWALLVRAPRVPAPPLWRAGWVPRGPGPRWGPWLPAHQLAVLRRPGLRCLQLSRPPIAAAPPLVERLRPYGPLGLGVALLVAKWQYALVALKLAKLAPLLQIGASVLAYSFFLGWQYSVGAVALLFVHELGHFLAMKALGLQPGRIVFIPFLGAGVQMNRLPSTAMEDAIVALAGPLMGGAVSIGVLLYALSTGHPLAGALANFGLLINLINMVPLSLLDGGRVMKAIDRRLMLLGIPIFGCVAYAYSNPILMLFFVLGVLATAEAFKVQKDDAFFDAPPLHRGLVVLVYFVCLVLLLFAFEISQEVKVPIAELGGSGGLSESPAQPSRVLAWYNGVTDALQDEPEGPAAAAWPFSLWTSKPTHAFTKF